MCGLEPVIEIKPTAKTFDNVEMYGDYAEFFFFWLRSTREETGPID